MSRLKDLNEKHLKLVADARAKLDEITDGIDEARAKEIEAEYDRIMADADRTDGLIKREQELAGREAAIEARAAERRPGADGAVPAISGGVPEESDEVRAKKYRKAFDGYLRYGDSALTGEQRGILVRERRGFGGEGVTAGADFGYGQYLVPQGFQAELVKSLALWGPMCDGGIVRQLVTASGQSIPWPTVDDTGNTGAQIAENTQVSLAEITFGTKNLEAYKYTSGVVLVSQELLQDSALDVEVIVRDLMAERLGRICNTDCTTGTGSSKPHGLVYAAATGVTAAAVAAVTLDELIDLEHSVDPLYRTDPSCRFMFNDGTLKAIRKIKDSYGRYIWQPSDVKAGQPAMLLNYPYSINQAMAALGAGNKTVVFGAFNRYICRMTREFSVRRLVERYADYDQVGFIGFMRMDGELLDAGAVKALSQHS